MKMAVCFPISGSEVRKIAVLCSNDIKKPLTMTQSYFLTFLLLKKSRDSTSHQKLSQIEKQEFSVLSSLSC